MTSSRPLLQSGLGYVGALPGTSRLEDSATRGWTSLLATHSRASERCDPTDTLAVPAQMICMITRGAGHLSFLDGRWRNSSFLPGTIYLTGAEERYRMQWRSDATAGPIERLHVFVPVALFAQAADHFRRPGLKAPAQGVAALAVRNGAVERVCGALLRAMRDGLPDVYAQAAAQWLAVHLLSAGPDELTQQGSRSERLLDGRLARALDYIDANLGDAISLAAIAAEAGVSKFHFARLFHRAIGRTPLQYVLERRLDRAAALLAAGDGPISQVAFKAGFVNVAHFNGAFRDRFGMAPGVYRRGGSDERRRARDGAVG